MSATGHGMIHPAEFGVRNSVGRSARQMIGGAEGMAMKFHGNVRGEARVNFLALLASKSHIFVWCPQKF